MKRKVLLLVVMAALSLPSVAQDPDFWIFLCLGQANMAGMVPYDSNDGETSERFVKLSETTTFHGDKVYTWDKAKTPICRADAGLGMLESFGRVMLQRIPDNVRIGLVCAAIDNAPIDFFDKDAPQPLSSLCTDNNQLDQLQEYGGQPYEYLVRLARRAKNKGVVKGILFHQGETDGYSEEWEQKVVKVYHDLCADLGLEVLATPMFVGEVLRSEQGGTCAAVNDHIAHLPYVAHNVYVVSSEGCEGSSDHVSFSADGYRTLGTHYAERYLERMEEYMPRQSRQEEASSVTTVKVTQMSINADFDDDNDMWVEASEPLDRVDIRDSSGKLLTVFRFNGKSNLKVPIHDLLTQPIVLEFHAVSGNTRTIRFE